MKRVAIVTGGASGIGRALSAALVRRGDHVVVADVNGDAAAATAEALSAGPGRAVAEALDVRDATAVAELIGRTHEDEGRLDLLFNNAGIGAGGKTEELGLDHWERTIDINLRGVVHGIHAAYPLMCAQGHGHIVNTASMAGLVPSPGLVPYAMTKFGVVGLSLSLRPEAKARGVRVSVVCPGVIDTPILDKKYPDDLPKVPSVEQLDGRAFLSKVAGKPYPAEKLADDVLRGLDRNEAVIITPGLARAAARVWRHLPALFWRQADRAIHLAERMRR